VSQPFIKANKKTTRSQHSQKCKHSCWQCFSDW